jgi:hypothetical protein
VGTTPLGIVYPDSTSHNRIWEHAETLATDVDDLITADRAKRDVVSGTYTPSITGSVSGTWVAGASTISGRYLRLGRMVFVWVDITLGASVSISGACDGTLICSLPVTAARVTPAHCGSGFVSRGAGGRWVTAVELNTTSNCIFVLAASGSTLVAGSLLSTDGTPNGNVWASTDVLRFECMYEAASAA